MRKRLFIGCIVAVLSSCATSQAPLDDAYYYPDKSANTTVTADDSSNQSNPSVSERQSTPVVEYLNVQDTTITVRIKK